VHATFARLDEGGVHDLFGNALDLDVHLESGDAALGAGDFEIHVAEVILVAQYVGEHREAVAFLDEAHRDAATCAFIGTPASISARQPPHTDAIELEPFDSVISDTTRSE
jgi:hypothetical protein